MTKKALLVGINYPGTSHSLRGCVNDVITMNQVITNHFGFTESANVRMLTDQSATTANILSRLEWLVADAKSGDVLFFHYSGHGSQVIDSPHAGVIDEIDGKDEILCPIDLDWRTKIIRDDDLKRIFDKVPEGVNLTVLLDCCHSGDGIDSQDHYQPMGGMAADFDPMSPNRNRLLEMPADIACRGYGLNLDIKPRAVQSGNGGILISGCQSQQTSADAHIANRWQGAATFFLARQLAKNNFDMTYRALIEGMNKELSEFNYTQRPELNGQESFFDTKFLAPLVTEKL